MRFTGFPTLRLGLAAGAAALLLLAPRTQAYPIGSVTFRDDAPFQGATSAATLTSGDGLLTVQGWADTGATVLTNLYQWWWILGVNSGVGNGALLDGSEAMTLQFDTPVGASHIAFLYSGGSGGLTNNLARVTISGFLSDPGAYAATYLQQRIFNLSYAAGALTFDYLWDTGNDYGLLLLSNPAASRGQTLKITGAVSPNGDASGYGLALFRVDSTEIYGRPRVEPVSVRHNYTNRFTTPDGLCTVRAYADSNAVTSANFGIYADQCFGVYGGRNTGAIETNESVTLQFAAGVGLSRLETIYSGGPVRISGFLSDPGFSDPGLASVSAAYAGGALTFSILDGGHHLFFFTNRAASAGQTLRVNVDTTTNDLAIAGIEYVNLQTLVAGDIPSNVQLSHSTPDGKLTLNAYADTPGTSPAYLFENVDWFGIAGGLNNEAIDGTESLDLQFSGGFGLTGLGTRYTSGQVIISGFTSDPGFIDPSGIATGVSYSAGTLSFTFNSWRSPEVVFKFSNPAASANQKLSLHSDGLPTSQIALTRITYALPSVTLSMVKSGNDVVLTWPTGTLQQSTNVTGTYTDLTTATSPYTNAVSGGQKYFRVRVQ